MSGNSNRTERNIAFFQELKQSENDDLFLKPICLSEKNDHYLRCFFVFGRMFYHIFYNFTLNAKCAVNKFLFFLYYYY